MMLGCKEMCDFFDDVYTFLWTSDFSIYLLPADV